MNLERIQSVGDRAALPYQKNRAAYARRKKAAVKPIDAVICDTVEISREYREAADEYSWLTAMIIAMPDEDVAAKMRSIKDSIIDIDDAVVEKVIFEAI